jgi:hypothetical protein
MLQLLRTLVQPTLDAWRTYWLALVIIQSCALGMVIAYYEVVGAAAVFDQLAAWKIAGGMPLAALVTVLSGGVVPELLKRALRPVAVQPPSVGELAHQFAMWAGLGIMIDAFYVLQSQLFGTGTDALTLLYKVAFDQLVFAPLITMPLMVLWFFLRECRYQFGRWWREIRLQLVVRRAASLWFSCLSFWPVMLLIIYSLPTSLQFPLFLFANAAYSILMIFIARRQVAAGH